MFSAQSLLASNGASVTCLRESREPITTLNVATYVMPLVVQNSWLCRIMQDNDPKHTSRRAQAFMEKNGINRWRTPLESPDLNPMEDLWHELKFYLASRVKPQTKQQLVDGIRKFWTEKLTADK